MTTLDQARERFNKCLLKGHAACPTYLPRLARKGASPRAVARALAEDVEGHPPCPLELRQHLLNGDFDDLIAAAISHFQGESYEPERRLPR